MPPRNAPATNGAPKAPPRKERLAVNLYDLGRLDPVFRQRVLGGRLNVDCPVWVDRNREDEQALEFVCPLLEAALAIDIIRSQDRKTGEAATRAYVFREAWSRISGRMTLTELDEQGKARLSREAFPAPAPLVPPSRDFRIVGEKL
jgi:hypothetical protein